MSLDIQISNSVFFKKPIISWKFQISTEKEPKKRADYDSAFFRLRW